MPPKAVKGEYIETDTGNKVSRKSQIHGTQNIILGGRTVIQADVCIRGDLHKTLPPPSSSSITTSAPAQDQKQQQQQQQQQHPNVAVAIGRYTFLSKGSLLRPPSKLHRGLYSYYPLKIGDHVFIGENCFVEAAVVGSNVHIGKGSVIGKFAIIKDCVKVLEGTVVPAGMVVPSWSVVAGRPGRVVGELGDGWGVGEGSEGGDLRELWRSV